MLNRTITVIHILDRDDSILARSVRKEIHALGGNPIREDHVYKVVKSKNKKSSVIDAPFVRAIYSKPSNELSALYDNLLDVSGVKEIIGSSRSIPFETSEVLKTIMLPTVGTGVATIVAATIVAAAALESNLRYLNELLQIVQTLIGISGFIISGIVLTSVEIYMHREIKENRVLSMSGKMEKGDFSRYSNLIKRSR